MVYTMRARRRRKSTRRRRTSRRRNKYSRPDGYHSEKIIYNQTLKAKAGGETSFYFSWLKALPNAGSAGNNQSVAGVGNTDKQFSQCATLYREYRVTGVRFVYTPQYSVTPGYVLGSVKMGSKQYTADEPIPVTSQDIQGAFDQKVYNPMTTFKRFYNIGAWAKSKDIGWQVCEDILSNPPENIPQYDMVTGLVARHSTGLPLDSLLADMTITYYVKFRGRTASNYVGNFA